MSYDELELDKLGDEKTALFFLISDTDSTYNFIVALAFSQMFNLLCERADNKYGGRLPHHVRVLWDEAANTGQVPGLEKIVAVIRSREVSLTLFYQAMSQCKALYKDNAETIMGNMDSIVFLGGREASTLKDISENWLGKATISMQTDSRTRGQSESYGLNTQRLGRELLTTSEITTMPGNKCLLQLRGLPPFFSPKYDLKQHPNYRYTAEHDSKRNAFHLERLTSRRLRLKPEEEYAARYNGFVERYEKAKARLEQLRTTKAAREAQAEAIGAFMFEMQELDTLTEFDEKLWLTTIDTVTVHADGRMTFKFQGGTEIEG